MHTYRAKSRLHRSGARSLEACILSVILLSESRADADCFVLPGPDGEVTSWLATAPVSTPRRNRRATVAEQLSATLSTRALATAAPRAGALWEPVTSNTPRLRLRGGTSSRTSFYGLTLRAQRATQVILFVGGDDGLAVYLDGVLVGQRAAVRPAREDDDAITLTLTAGSHQLVMRQYVHGGEQAIYARFVGPDFLPTDAVRLVLDGVSDNQCAELARRAASWTATRSVVDGQLRLDTTLCYPGGTPFTPNETARELRFTDTSEPSAAGQLSLTGRFVGAVSARRAVSPGASTVSVNVAGSIERTSCAVAPAVFAALAAATRVIDPLNESALPSWLPRASFWSAKYVQQRLAQLVSDADPDSTHLLEEAQLLADICAQIERSRDPYAARTGALRRAYRSVVDGTLQPYSLYVPPGYTAQVPRPLVVALHGLHGSSHRMLPILFGNYDKDEDRTHADRHFDPPPASTTLLLAPYGFGDAFYRGVGETDVLQALASVREAYSVDADRTYMTGLSMGGIGAASIPLHYPSVFAAAAPLCGYHDYFVRSDTRPPRRAWEEFAMQARSNRNWAENGLHLPMYIVQGTLDRPITNSTTFADRYRELHYEIESEYPELGHDVWTSTYAGGRLFERFAHYRRTTAPARVRFRTISTRWRSSFWLGVNRLSRAGVWADVDANIRQNALQISSQNVDSLTVDAPPSLLRAPYDVRFVGESPQTLRVTSNGAISFVRSAQQSQWVATTEAAIEPPLGPIRDEFDRHIIVVYGAREPSQTALNRRVAEHWAKIRAGVRVRLQIIADDAYVPSMARATTVVLVGTVASNSVLARMSPGFAIQASSTEITAGSQHFAGATGATFVARSPDALDGSVIAVTGTSVMGVWRSLFLPDLLPDYIIYGEAIAPARGRVILGAHATVACAGFYSAQHAVEPSCSDMRSAALSSTSSSEAPTTNGDE
jgi:poly(3-hydroxybutyrate) depolymerase